MRLWMSNITAITAEGKTWLNTKLVQPSLHELQCTCTHTNTRSYRLGIFTAGLVCQAGWPSRRQIFLSSPNLLSLHCNSSLIHFYPVPYCCLKMLCKLHVSLIDCDVLSLRAVGGGSHTRCSSTPVMNLLFCALWSFVGQHIKDKSLLIAFSSASTPYNICLDSFLWSIFLIQTVTSYFNLGSW